MNTLETALARRAARRHRLILADGPDAFDMTQRMETRNKYPWTEDEKAIALDLSLSSREAARQLNRTVRGVNYLRSTAR